MRKPHWTEIGAFLFLLLITAQLLTLIFWPYIIILEDNKTLVTAEFVVMVVFDYLYWRHVIKT